MAEELAVPLVLQGAKALYGLFQSNKANKALDELNKTPYPEFATGQEIYGEADKMATGFSPSEMASAQNSMNRLNNQRYRLGVDRSPTLGGVIQAGTNFGSVAGTLDLAARDAQARRQNLNQLISLIGGQKNLKTQSEIQRRQQEEAAYGGAAQQGVENIFGGLQDASNMLFSYGLNNKYLNAIGGGRMLSPTTTPTAQATETIDFVPDDMRFLYGRNKRMPLNQLY